MRKKSIVILMTIISGSLVGCSRMNSYIEERLIKESGILQDEQYIKYVEYRETGNIDSDGSYYEQMEQLVDGKIHITFSDNNNLEIKYYTDRDCINQIDTTNCYLNPGTSIYAEIVISKDIYSSMYEFDSFNVSQYNENGKRVLLEKWNQEIAVRDNCYFVEIQVPSNYEGNEVSLEPVGKYQKREIVLNDYYVDELNNRYSLDGIWKINEITCVDDVAEVNAISSYIVSYEYDTNEYFYSNSSPEYYFIDNENGNIIFNKKEATDETEDYVVELSKYISISLISGEDRTIIILG